jgi:ATP/maltotriose-dependent transcriptional regulator MalT
LEGVFTEERVELLKLLSNQTVFAKVIKKLLERDNSESMDEKCPAGTVSLTGREVEILKLISKGLSNSEIAEGLGVTNNTIKTHVKNIYGKLQVNRRVQAVARAKELNIK